MREDQASNHPPLQFLVPSERDKAEFVDERWRRYVICLVAPPFYQRPTFVVLLGGYG